MAATSNQQLKKYSTYLLLLFAVGLAFILCRRLLKRRRTQVPEKERGRQKKKNEAREARASPRTCLQAGLRLAVTARVLYLAIRQEGENYSTLSLIL